MSLLKRTFAQISPTLAALTKHKVAVVLIVAQIALSLAIVSNALFIVSIRFQHLSRPTGVDESKLFIIKNEWASVVEPSRLDALLRADLNVVRSTPGVEAAFSSEAYPLEGGGGWLTGLKTTLEDNRRPTMAFIYFADADAIRTLGVRLIQGRNFLPAEVSALGIYEKLSAPSIIVSRHLADKLFPAGDALGKSVYMEGASTSIVGIVDVLQGPYAGSTTRRIDEDAILVPRRLADPSGSIYIVRTSADDMARIASATVEALLQKNRMRVINPDGGVVRLTEARYESYAVDRGVAVTMAAISVLLLLATSAGIVGLSSFWVAQRRSQIGVRRALGATRRDIFMYFHMENLLIVTIGVIIGCGMALGANLLLMSYYELPRLPLIVVPIGAVMLWLVGQFSVHWPARRAASVAPIEAIRTL